MSDFDQKLATGRECENKIARWLAKRDRVLAVVSVYNAAETDGFFRGPRVFTKAEGCISPDLLGFTVLGSIWFETKQKSVFTWHRITSRWVTGIDLNHYVDYQRVSEQTHCPVWLLFLHEQAIPHARDRQFCSTHNCPTGLFGGELSFLTNNENHRHDNWGRHGMVYWAHETLRQFATLEEMAAI